MHLNIKRRCHGRTMMFYIAERDVSSVTRRRSSHLTSVHHISVQISAGRKGELWRSNAVWMRKGSVGGDAPNYSPRGMEEDASGTRRRMIISGGAGEAVVGGAVFFCDRWWSLWYCWTRKRWMREILWSSSMELNVRASTPRWRAWVSSDSDRWGLA